MKRLLPGLCLAILLCSPCLALTVTDTTSTTPTAMAQRIMGSGVVVSNATFTGGPVAGGTFAAGVPSGIGIESGVLLSSGSVLLAPGPNSSSGTSVNNGTPGDTALQAIIGGTATYDAAALEFDFVAIEPVVQFRFVFGSDEYNEYVGGSYNDVFAIFVDGLNAALLPTTRQHVSINNINLGVNPSLFKNNAVAPAPYDVQYDGFSVVLVATATTTVGATHHVKIAIADAGDSGFDTTVFVEDAASCPTPPEAVATGTTRVCLTGSAQLQGSGGAICNWLPVTGLDDPTSCSPVATPTSTTTYSLSVEEGGCTSSNLAIVTVSVDTAPPAKPVAEGIPAYCTGDTLTLTTASGAPAYQWYLGGVTIDGATSPTLVIEALQGTHAGAYTVVTSNGCGLSEASDPVIVEVFQCNLNASALAIDRVTIGVSDLNGVLEPGEQVSMEPAWRNVGDTSVDVAGTLSDFGGPNGTTYDLLDTTSSYSTIVAGTVKISDGYGLSVGTFDARPAAHVDAVVTEAVTTSPATGNAPKVWTVHVGDSFTDMPRQGLFYKFTETLLHNAITAGCTPTTYCPGASVPRNQMAAFIARAMVGNDEAVPTTGGEGESSYNCAFLGNSLFYDVYPTDLFCRHIHYLKQQKITLGCNGPAGLYCQDDSTPRGQMALFIARALVAPDGDAAVPMNYADPVTGRSYSCETEDGVHFPDVPHNAVYCRHVHYIWALGVIDGFTDGSYQPDGAVTREQMSKYLSQAFELKLYHP